MTLTTGKSGRYRYYKCTTQVNKGKPFCSAAIIRMDKLDQLVLDRLSEHAFTPQRLQLLLAPKQCAKGYFSSWLHWASVRIFR